jgi:hypothetical protein
VAGRAQSKKFAQPINTLDSAPRARDAVLKLLRRHQPALESVVESVLERSKIEDGRQVEHCARGSCDRDGADRCHVVGTKGSAPVDPDAGGARVFRVKDDHLRPFGHNPAKAPQGGGRAMGGGSPGPGREDGTEYFLLDRSRCSRNPIDTRVDLLPPSTPDPPAYGLDGQSETDGVVLGDQAELRSRDACDASVELISLGPHTASRFASWGRRRDSSTRQGLESGR